MFKQGKKSAGYDWPVEVLEPEDGGKYSRHKFTAHFKRFTQSEADALTEKIGEAKDDGTQYKVVDLVVDIVDGWGKEVIDESDQPVPFSEAALRQMCNDTPSATGAIFNAWIEALSKGKEKNFRR